MLSCVNRKSHPGNEHTCGDICSSLRPSIAVGEAELNSIGCLHLRSRHRALRTPADRAMAGGPHTYESVWGSWGGERRRAARGRRHRLRQSRPNRTALSPQRTVWAGSWPPPAPPRLRRDARGIHWRSAHHRLQTWACPGSSGTCRNHRGSTRHIGHRPPADAWSPKRAPAFGPLDRRVAVPEPSRWDCTGKLLHAPQRHPPPVAA